MEAHDNILKAQKLYSRMIECATPQAFKKTLATAIAGHTLDEFYPVVVRAELCAALFLSGRQQQAGDAAVPFAQHLSSAFSLKPGHLLGMDVQVAADIMDLPAAAVETLLKNFGYSIEDGVAAGHPAAHGPARAARAGTGT